MVRYGCRAGLAEGWSPAWPCSQLQAQVISPIAQCRKYFLPPALLSPQPSATSASGEAPRGAKLADQMVD